MAHHENESQSTPIELVGRVRQISAEIDGLKLSVTSPIPVQITARRRRVEMREETIKVGNKKTTKIVPTPIEERVPIVHWKAHVVEAAPENEPVAMSCPVHDPQQKTPVLVEGFNPDITLECSQMQFYETTDPLGRPIMRPLLDRRGRYISCGKELTTLNDSQPDTV